MAKNDLLLQAARRERTARTPVWLMRQAGRFDPDYLALRQRLDLPLEDLFCDAEAATEISLFPRRFGVDAIIFFQDILTPLTPMGRGFVFRPGPLLENPVRSTDDVKSLRRYDPSTALPFVRETLTAVRKSLDGELPLLGFAGAPVTLAFFLIEGRSPLGTGKSAQAMMEKDPKLFRMLVDLLTDVTIEYLSFQIESGVDAWQLFESVADLLTHEQYEAFAHPAHVRIFAELGRRVPSILFCKDHAPLEMMAASGADVLSVPASVDLADARRRFGHRVAFQGNVEPRLLQDGTGDEIEEAVQACIRAGDHQGHILNLGHGVLKDTPVDNVRRFVETARSTRLEASVVPGDMG